MHHQPILLIVDDQPRGRDILATILEPAGYHFIFAESGHEAIKQAQRYIPDVVLLDVMMPDMDGFEVCRQLRSHPELALVPILLVTALDDQESRLQGIDAGADDVITKPFNRAELRARVRTIVRLNRFRTMLNERQQAAEELAGAYDATLEGWSRALDLRDHETEGHSRRVTEMTIRLAQEFGFVGGELEQIRRGALLHDIGKMGIPDAILLKPGPLNPEEWAVMRRHPSLAYMLLAPIQYLRDALEIPLCHHEKWDGSGYPRGLRGTEIPLEARIFAVVDVWDALSHDRPYRSALPPHEVYQHLRHLAGSHLDPAVVEVFLRIVNGNDKEDGMERQIGGS